MGRYLKLTRKAAEGAMAETSSLSTAIMESLDGIKIIKISNREAAEEGRVGEVIERRQAHLIKGANARTMAAPATELLSGFLLAGLLAFAGWHAATGHLTTGGFTSFVGRIHGRQPESASNDRPARHVQPGHDRGAAAVRRPRYPAGNHRNVRRRCPAALISQAVTFDHAGFSL